MEIRNRNNEQIKIYIESTDYASTCAKWKLFRYLFNEEEQDCSKF